MTFAMGGVPHSGYFASSPHILDHDLPYHRSKREGVLLLTQSGFQVTEMLLPNTFGPGGKPFYNSVVSTFALLAAQGKVPERMDPVVLKLIPVRVLCRQIAGMLEEPFVSRREIRHTVELPLAELFQRLQRSLPEDDLDELLLEIKQRYLTHAADR